MRPSTRSPIGSIQKNHAWLPTIGQTAGRVYMHGASANIHLNTNVPQIGQEGPDNSLECEL